MIRTIDLNARIIDLDYKVEVINGHPLARIRFQNLFFGTIKALKVKIIGFNSFEEPVMVNDKLDYIALIQDIEINSGQNAENITIDIPNDEIRIIKVEIIQICYADGSICSASEPENVKYTIEEINSDTEESREILKKLKSINPKSICFPKKEEMGWICSCGYFNRITNKSCSCCGMQEEVELFECSEEKILKEIADEKQREDSKKRYYIIGAIIAVVVLLIIIIGSSIYSSQQLKKSNNEKASQTYESAVSAYDKGEYKEALDYLESVPESFEGASELKAKIEKDKKNKEHNDNVCYDIYSQLNEIGLEEAKKKIREFPKEYIEANKLTDDNIELLHCLVNNTWICVDEKSHWRYVLVFKFNSTGDLLCTEDEYDYPKTDTHYNTYNYVIDYNDMFEKSFAYVKSDDISNFVLDVGKIKNNTLVKKIDGIECTFCNAEGAAEAYLREDNYSKKIVYRLLINNNKYPESEAQKAVDSGKFDWKEIAKKEARMYYSYGGYSREEIYELLTIDMGFDSKDYQDRINLFGMYTPDEANYALNSIFGETS